MKNILQTLNLRPTEGEWGVEIEVEGSDLPQQFRGREWRVEHDGSLKAEEAFEYVTPKPLSKAGVRASLDVLEAAYVKCGSEVDESVRAGVHVHMNVQQFTAKEVFTFATLYFIMEELLVKYCGENREGNLFCLRSQDAEYQLFAIQEAVETKNWANIKTDNLRYASLNFQSLFKYGSLEFRSMRSTRNLDLIYQWVEILEELRDSSLKFKSPVDVMMSFSGEGEEAFLKRTFPTKWKLLTFPDYERSIRKACRRVQMLAYTIDWDNIGKPSNNPFLGEGGF